MELSNFGELGQPLEDGRLVAALEQGKGLALHYCEPCRNGAALAESQTVVIVVDVTEHPLNPGAVAEDAVQVERITGAAPLGREVDYDEGGGVRHL